MFDRLRLSLCLILSFVILVLAYPLQAQTNKTLERTRQIHMVVWRGCEEACLGFIRYFEDRDLPVKVTVTDVNRDKTALPQVKQQLIEQRPDLVVTWGTSVSRAILGTITDF